MFMQTGDNGVVNQYSRDVNTVFIGQHSINELFPGYPYKTIHASYVEWIEYERVYTLFYLKTFWQYKVCFPLLDAVLCRYNIVLFQETSAGNLYDGRTKKMIQFKELEEKQNRPISEWHGVSACNIDAVFMYNGM